MIYKIEIAIHDGSTKTKNERYLCKSISQAAHTLSEIKRTKSDWTLKSIDAYEDIETAAKSFGMNMKSRHGLSVKRYETSRPSLFKIAMSHFA